MNIKRIILQLIFPAIFLFVTGLLIIVYNYKNAEKKKNELKQHLAIIYEYASDKEKKLFCINKIDSLYANYKDSISYYDITMAKAFLYSRQLESNASIEILKKMLASQIVKKDLLLYRNVLNLMTNEYAYGTFDLSKTIEYSLKSIIISHKLEDEAGELRTKTNLLITIGAYRRSIESAILLIQLLKNEQGKSGKEHSIMYLYALVANAYIMINNHKSALEIDKLLIRYLDEHKKDKYALIKYGETWLQMSNIYLKLNKPDSAGIYYKKGNEILNKQFKNTKSAAIYSMRYNYLMYIKDYDAALRETIFFEKDMKIGNNDNTKVLYESLTKIYSKKHNYKKALKYLKLWGKISKKLYLKDYKSKSIANYFLKEQRKIFSRNSKIEHRLLLIRISTYIVILSFSFALIFFTLAKINRNRERKTQAILDKMQHRVELANEKFKYLEKLYNTIRQEVKENSERNIFDELEKLCSEEYIFLDKNINSIKVSHLLNSNRTYVNSIVKKYTNKSVNQYINYKRILYAQQIRSKYPDTNLEDIAKKVGFKSLDTFRRQFMKYTGKQPSKVISF